MHTLKPPDRQDGRAWSNALGVVAIGLVELRALANRSIVPDLFVSKAAAGREKEREFCMALLEHAYFTPAQVLALVPHMPLVDEEKRKLRATIRRWAKTLREAGHPIPEE